MSGKIIRSFAGVFIAAHIAAGAAMAGEMERVYQQILDDPGNIALNIRYAQLAEERGEPRKALATYERLVLSHPENTEVRRALQRLRTIMEPAFTRFQISIGGGYESNVRNRSSGHDGDGRAEVRLSVRDERHLSGYRWRSNAFASGTLYLDTSDLRNLYFGADTGPLVPVSGSSWRFRPSVGGALAYLDNSLLFAEARGELAFEGIYAGAFRKVAVRTRFRDVDSTFGGKNGIVVDVYGRYSFPGVIGDHDVFSISPRLTYNGAGGNTTGLGRRSLPGDYLELAGTATYAVPLATSITGAAGVSLAQRWFKHPATTGARDRSDFFLAPTASVTFRDLLYPGADIVARYTFEHNNSNQSGLSYSNHIGTVRSVWRF